MDVCIYSTLSECKHKRMNLKSDLPTLHCIQLYKMLTVQYSLNSEFCALLQLHSLSLLDDLLSTCSIKEQTKEICTNVYEYKSRGE